MTDAFPRENLIRAAWPGVRLLGGPDEARSADPFLVADGQRGPGITGHFAVFNQWTEINSLWEGNFLERIAPGAFKKTFRENRSGMRVLFQHGRDPQVADKPLGPIEDLSEDDFGARYDVALVDTSYNRDLIPGLQAGLYGASFRFNVQREELVMEPKPSDYNPSGLPERTIREARVSEFGPVTFPAYAGATAGMRSLTDEFLLDRSTTDFDRLSELVERMGYQMVPLQRESAPDHASAPAEDAGQEPTSDARRQEPASFRPLVVVRNPNRQNRRVPA